MQDEVRVYSMRSETHARKQASKHGGQGLQTPPAARARQRRACWAAPPHPGPLPPPLLRARPAVPRQRPPLQPPRCYVPCHHPSLRVHAPPRLHKHRGGRPIDARTQAHKSLRPLCLRHKAPAALLCTQDKGAQLRQEKKLQKFRASIPLSRCRLRPGMHQPLTSFAAKLRAGILLRTLLLPRGKLERVPARRQQRALLGRSLRGAAACPFDRGRPGGSRQTADQSGEASACVRACRESW